MRILFCPQAPASRELGGPKVVVELAEEMEKLGWECNIKSIPEIAQLYQGKGHRTTAEALKLYLQENAKFYDVVDYDHVYLPFDRDIFPPTTLFVARSVLLAHHFSEIKIPKPRTFFSRVRSLLRTRRNLRHARETADLLQNADKTVKEADLVNVSNDRDREILIRHGVVAKKIVVLPYGIDAKRRKLFDAVSELPPINPRVVFVGSFDYRKGCLDIPRIFAAIAKEVPQATFRLLGTAGLFQTERQVRQFFPAQMRKKIEVVPRYAADDLPQLLSDCSVGVFPSYLEGFGFGVIEMLAAAIPVIAYDAPGPSNILQPEMLVPPGDSEAMAEKIVKILTDPNKLQAQRILARKISNKYNWNKIALETSNIYRQHVQSVSAAG